MRRGRPEWLLVPLFLLPVLGGAGFLLHARAEYRRLLEPYRRDPAGTARAWLDRAPEKGQWLLRRFEEVVLSDRRGGTPFSLDGFAGEVWPRIDGLPEGPWTFARAFPAGLTPAALADPAVRLAVEAGGAPARAGELDPAAAALRDLLDRPDPDALRTAPLPAETKRWLARHWQRTRPEEPWFSPAWEMADAVSRLQPGAGGPGIHRFGEAVVLVSAGAFPTRVFGRRDAGPPILVPVDEDPDGVVRLLFFAAPGQVEPGVRLETPVAGNYAFGFPRGEDWWAGPVFRAWAGPVGGACLLFLALPVALLVSFRRARRHDAARTRFVNEIAHDLRTPLASLRLHADLLAAGRAPPEERPRYVETMAREAGRLSVLLENLLDLSRLERGVREYAIETVDLDVAAEAALRDFAALHPARAADVRVSGPDDATVRADRTALARILGNLLDNAGKYTPEGARIAVQWAAPEDGSVRIVVRDEGPGMPEGAGGDRGLGLVIVRELSEGMGGSFRILPTQGGAAFEVRLPGGGGG